MVNSLFKALLLGALVGPLYSAQATTCRQETLALATPTRSFPRIKARVLEMTSWLSDRSGTSLENAYKRVFEEVLETFEKAFLKSEEQAAIILAHRIITNREATTGDLIEARLTLEAAGFSPAQAFTLLHLWRPG
ncbi:MAG: hypothetical protein H6624_01225 [Bdellovibrionaceae bacterium]|nr:hypothetical protein [Bdellovibrionales bacterium]MCB9082930.1 hypothetical protein [Pseudobdellovibrionaceae bacterium]